MQTSDMPTEASAPATAAMTTTIDDGIGAGIAAAISAAAPALLEKWSRISLSTEPVDRAAAEAAVAELYVLAGIAPPRRFIWCTSPLEAARLVANAGGAEGASRGDGQTGGFGESLRQELRNGPWQRARAEVLASLGAAQWTQVWRETCGPLMPTSTRLVGAISTAIGDAAPDEAERNRLILALTFADHGQQDAAWLPLFEAYREAADAGNSIAGDAADAAFAVVHALACVAEQLHWWWPFSDAAILCERPTAIHLDDRGRLHNGDGAALTYADGFALYRWRGVAIAEDFADTLATLRPAVIYAERNAEVRRIMLEHYGHSRFIIDSGAKPVQEDEAGRLWRVHVDGDEPICMVEVVNATAEPDGTFRTYWLRVPPHLRSAKAAVAWTFGLTEQEYEPQIQT